jgi:hypothetical protein
MAVETGTLVVERAKKAWRDRARSYRIQIDGVTWFSVRRGERREVDLAAGPHRIRAKIDWTGSPELEFSIFPGSTTSFLVEPAGSSFSALSQIVGRSRYLKLSSTL